MTKKDYIAIAKRLAKRRVSPYENNGMSIALNSKVSEQWHFIVLDLAEYFQNQNPKFDRARFIEACNI